MVKRRIDLGKPQKSYYLNASAIKRGGGVKVFAFKKKIYFFETSFKFVEKVPTIFKLEEGGGG